MDGTVSSVGAFLACLFVVASPLVGAAAAAPGTAVATQTGDDGGTGAGTQHETPGDTADDGIDDGTATTPVDEPDETPFTCTGSPGEYAETSSEGEYEFADQVVVDLESQQDGEPIQVAYVRPADPETGEPIEDSPVILRGTPYVDDLRNDSMRECAGLARLTENFVEHGYTVAVTSVRGTGGSGGCFDYMGPAEQADLDQAVTWLGEADWSNGNVAMIGGSYDGTTQWEVAAMGNPHLATIVPISGVTNVRELRYKRGSPEYAAPLLNPLYYGISGAHSPVSGTKPTTYASRAGCPEVYATGMYASTYSQTTGERDPNGWMTARNQKPGVERNYEGSILLVQGLQDWNVDPSQVYPWVEELERQEEIDRIHLVFGQWGHATPDSSSLDDETRRDDWADYLLNWFDYHLKGDESVDLGPRVHVQDSSGEWRTGDDWPPEDAEADDWYADADGNLGRSPADGNASGVVHVDPAREYGVGPADPGLDCEGCVTFETGSFEESYRFAGVPTVNVTATPAGPNGHLTGYLYAVNGSESRRLGWGMTDLRFADGGPDAEHVAPGESVEVSLPLEPLDAKVEPGERLVVVLHQGEAVDRMRTSAHPIQVATDHRPTLTVTAFDLEDDEKGDDCALPPEADDRAPPC